ncbi:hypothetical protein [Planococcus ruber]|uniref:hypothetical protein n=1 Tax=Planococcus ruber TaxID=2027871 RepID=UPI001FED639E|nr:hypothetical protein [Planococcus ruber]MCJ1908973.1 hypothetical protein [Planococcus ruber]
MADKKALKILFKRYWSSEGWTNSYLTKEELNYAKAAGVMFEQKKLSHDEAIQKLAAVISTLSLEDIATQFVASLSSRRLELRSALGSFMVGRHLIAHEYLGDENICSYCGGFNKKQEFVDLNVLNFERFKWGGVRHLDPFYIAFDLEQFSKAEKLTPTREDHEILHRIFSVVDEFPGEGKVGELEKALSKVLKSNKDERRVLLEILGFCSILSTNDRPGFIDHFIPYLEREEPSHAKNDWSYPVCWWTGKHGLNKNAIKEIFSTFPFRD